MSLIINASPQVVSRGTNDLSTRPVFPEPPVTPQHLPKFYVFAKKGPTTPQLVSSAEKLKLFDTETFDTFSAYFNHATLFSNLVSAEANTQMIQRVIPPDALPPAAVRIWADVVFDDTIPNYHRNPDGSITMVDATPPAAGDTIAFIDPTTPTISGNRIKFYIEHDVSNSGLDIGAATQASGKMVSSLTTGGVTSTMYPIMDVMASSQGEFGNNVGFRLFPAIGDDANPSILEGGILPYIIAAIKREDNNSTARVVPSRFGENAVDFSFKHTALNPITEAPYDFDNTFPDQWENVDDIRFPLQFSDYGETNVYYDNITALLGMIVANEEAYVSSAPIAIPGTAGTTSTLAWYDYTVDTDIATDELHLTNFLTLMSTKRVPYFTAIIDDGPLVTPLAAGFTNASFGKNVNHWLGSGSDGTMTEAVYEAEVVHQLEKYLDPNSNVMDTAINVESTIYDSGFTLDTKKELCNFIALRKDTFVSLGTWSDNLTQTLSVADEQSLAIALRTRLELFPESEYFGTPVMRGIVVGQSGYLRNSQYKKRVSLLAEVAINSARYMGAGNEKWKTGFNFDSAPGNILTRVYDVEPDFIPAGIKPIIWETGLNWAQPYDRRSFFFPALQTIYSNDTSVLNSYFTAMAIAYINKIAHRAWRRFTGTSGLTNSQFADRVVRYVEQELANRFDNRYITIPEVIFTQADTDRGYSWTLVVKIGAPNMKTVMTTWVEAFRIEDLQA